MPPLQDNARPPILVIGATGNVGYEVVQQLKQLGAPVRAASVNVGAARAKLGDGVEIVPFDFLNPDTFAATFAGVERMFLVRPPKLANVPRDIAPAVMAAQAAGVKQVIFLSLQGVEDKPYVPHYKIEQLIRESGMGWVFLRAGFFMQNLSTTHRQDIAVLHDLFVPAGNAKTGFVDVRDIGEVAAKLLIDANTSNRVYTLTGGQALTYNEIATVFSDVLQVPIRYSNPPAWRFLWHLVQAGQPIGYAVVVTLLYVGTRNGMASQLSNDVAELLGKPPRTIRQFVEDYRAAWQPAA